MSHSYSQEQMGQPTITAHGNATNTLDNPDHGRPGLRNLTKPSEAQVRATSISTSGPGFSTGEHSRNPIEEQEKTGQWIPVEEAINYYHLHPKESVSYTHLTLPTKRIV